MGRYFEYNKLGRSPQELIEQMKKDCNTPLGGVVVMGGKKIVWARQYESLDRIPDFVKGKIYDVNTGQRLNLEGEVLNG